MQVVEFPTSMLFRTTESNTDTYLDLVSYFKLLTIIVFMILHHLFTLHSEVNSTFFESGSEFLMWVYSVTKMAHYWLKNLKILKHLFGNSFHIIQSNCWGRERSQGFFVIFHQIIIKKAFPSNYVATQSSYIPTGTWTVSWHLWRKPSSLTTTQSK